MSIPSYLGRMATPVDAILLAAGNSSRMGSPKQLLPVEGTALLVRTIRTLSSSGVLRNILVVLGAHAPELEGLVLQEGASVIVNDQWSRGMGSSLKLGVAHLMRQTVLPCGLLISVCDQPFLTAEVIRAVAIKADEHSIIASDYGGSLGPPSCFGSSFFSALLTLPDDAGARMLFNRYPEKLIKVSFPEGATDLDTPEDYNRYLQRS